MTSGPPLSTTQALAHAALLVDGFLLTAWAKKLEELSEAAALRRRLAEMGVPDETLADRVAAELCAAPPSLLETVDRLCAVMAQWHQGLPVLDSAAQARRLARVVDPDAVFTLCPELQPPADERFDWPAVPLPEGGPTAGLLRYGSVDTHIHLGGALPPLFYWLPLMGGEMPFEAVRSLPSPERGHAGHEDWMQRIAHAAWLRLHLAARLEARQQRLGRPPLFRHLPAGWLHEPPFAGARPPGSPGEIRDAVQSLTRQDRACRMESPGDDWPFGDPLRDPAAPRGAETGERSWSRLPHYAQGERRLLYHLGCWRRHPEDRGDGQAAEGLEPRLREYLEIRNAFHGLLVHDRGREGLWRFVETFGRRGFLFGREPRRRPRRPNRRRRRYHRLVAKLERSRMTAALDAQLAEPFHPPGPPPPGEPRRRIELRVSLPPLRMLPLTLRAWLDGLRDHLRLGENVYRKSQVGLLVHLLKRGRDTTSQRDAEATAERLAFALGRYPGLRPFLVGVDAAGAERKSTPRVFGTAFRRLQHDLETFRAEPGCPPTRLGWTFHVGEDVEDLLTGLRHLDEAASLLLPRGEGGRLGHALALADDPRRFYQRRGGRTEPTLGTHLLDLVWAWAGLRQEGLGGERRWVEQRIRELCPGFEPRIFACSRAMELTPISAGRPARPAEAPDPEGPILLETELLARLCAEPPPAALEASRSEELGHRLTVTADRHWLELTEKLQELLRERLARMRLCIEANPTSNLLIGGFADYGELPYRKLTDAGLALSLNTDDPGLFMTTLPGEFAALYQALSDDLRHRETLGWLYERLMDADRSTFLGTQVPTGAEAWEQAGKALEWRPGVPA